MNRLDDKSGNPYLKTDERKKDQFKIVIPSTSSQKGSPNEKRTKILEKHDDKGGLLFSPLNADIKEQPLIPTSADKV